MNTFHKPLLVIVLTLALPVVASASCNTLIITVTDPDWQVNPNGSCTHGAINSTTDDQVVTGNVGSFGPDCTIHFVNTSTSDTASVEFQQNYCVLEAGSITVRPVSGPRPIYTKAEGSYSDGTPGKVTITGFSGTSDSTQSCEQESSDQ